MRIHVIVGCREFLRPNLLNLESAEGLIPQEVRVARACWLSQGSGDQYHDFLQDEPGDTRTAVMAQALLEGFGSRFEPLLVLPELLDENAVPADQDRRSQRTVLAELLDSGHFDRLVLYGLALSSRLDPDRCWAAPAAIDTPSVAKNIDHMRAEFAERMAPDSVATQIIELECELPCYTELANNALCNRFAHALELQMLDDGWSSDSVVLKQAILRILDDWNSRGMYVRLPLKQEDFDRFTDLLYRQLRRT
jgi:hypothetical protein